MLFTSLSFLLFTGLAVAVYFALPVRARWAWLLVASWYFYASWAPSNFVYLAAVTLAAYGCGWGIARGRSPRRKRLLLLAGLLSVLGILSVFKFWDFLVGEIESLLGSAGAQPEGAALPRLGVRTPVGLSFYTFSVVTYLVDVYAGRMTAEAHVGKFGVYVAFFPKIFAGPIERARTFLPQLGRVVRLEPDRLVSGLQLILWGLVKKVVIADNLAPFVDKGFGNPAYAPPVDLILATYFFAFQIYCDFSGYTDIAIGVSRVLGFELVENFRRPYLARSPADFWGRRWHLSLAGWFRDYMYIPLGGSRVGRLRHYFNIMAVFMVSGLWHAGLGYGVGWTFLVWGALNGLYQWAGVATAPVWQRVGRRLPRLGASPAVHVFRVMLTFHLIAFAWIFFRAGSVPQALTVIRRIGSSLGTLPRLLPVYPFSWEHYTALALIGLLIGIEIADERRPMFERLRAAPVPVRWTFYYAAIFALLLVGRWQAREFIYMQF